MMSLLHYVSFAIASVGLAACQTPNYSHDYLVEHPLLLKDEIEYCQSLQTKTPTQAQRCENAMSAASTVMTLINERQQDPEKFGQRVLDNEIACVKAKQLYDAAKQSIKTNQGTEGSLEVQKQVADNKQTYEAKRKEVKALLAVIGLSGPE